MTSQPTPSPTDTPSSSAQTAPTSPSTPSAPPSAHLEPTMGGSAVIAAAKPLTPQQMKAHSEAQNSYIRTWAWAIGVNMCVGGLVVALIVCVVKYPDTKDALPYVATILGSVTGFFFGKGIGEGGNKDA